MTQIDMFIIKIAVLVGLTAELCSTDDVVVCDRRPLGTKAVPLPPDDRFQITINGIIDDRYIPNQKYTVTLFSSDHESKFIAFTISAMEDTVENPKNYRRPIPLKPGNIYPSPDTNDGISSQICNNTVIQSNIMPKTSVEVVWLAPPKGNGCITIYAVVAVKADVWYSNEGPLIKKICEDRRQKDDMQPPLNNHCTVCDEARYLLTFEGHWTFNTHPTSFPAYRELARFSDLVGASHTNHYELYRFNKEASSGLKMLAEQGNTTKLEIEIQEKYKTGVRTIIKAKGQPDPNTPTYSMFRVNRNYHRISIVTAILPSPDWFLGVANLELCELNNKWAPSVTLNLYPLDAGTDSGKSFESPNDETSPPQPISSAVFTDVDRGEEIRKVKHFARLKLELVRTYKQANCTEDNSKGSNVENEIKDYDEDADAFVKEKNIPYTSTTSERTYTTIKYPASASPYDCPLSEWEEWLPCTGECIDGKIEGFQTRVRYHLVDGIPVDKYDEHAQFRTNKDVPQSCRTRFADSETRECEDDCEPSVTEEEQQQGPLSPGHNWHK